MRKALLTNEYISHGLTSLASGWTVTMLTAVPAVHYALYFAFSVPIISVCFISSSATTFFTAIYVVPAICKRYCIARSIYIGHCWQLVMMIVLSLPWVNRSPVAYPICIAVSQIGLCLAVNPNQNRSSIGRMHTVNGTGALTGVTRVLFSCGESTGPLVGILLLYPIGTLGGPSDPRVGTLLPFMVTPRPPRCRADRVRLAPYLTECRPGGEATAEARYKSRRTRRLRSHRRTDRGLHRGCGHNDGLIEGCGHNDGLIWPSERLPGARNASRERSSSSCTCT